MKTVSLALSLILLQAVAIPLWADSAIKGDDYPVLYEVLDASKGGKVPGNKLCTMTLRDQSQNKVVLNVSRKGLGACHVLDTGKVYRGRVNQKKNEVELVILIGTDKARIEDWQIDGTVGVTPK